MDLELAGHRFWAHSIGGIETCLRFDALSLCLDIGRCPPGAENCKTLLLTHAHIDHAAGLPYYVSLRGLLGAAPPRVYCPAADRDALWSILQGWSRLQADSDRCELIGVMPGDEIPLGRNHFARAFRSPHRIATLGYTVFERRKKLRSELLGESESQIAARSRAGENVAYAVEIPQICFPGDTRAEVIDREPTVAQARLLAIECTFLGQDTTVAHARKSGHIHMDELAARADRFQNEAVLLTHFSRRYRRETIDAEVKKLPKNLRDRVHVLHHPRG